MKAQHFLIALLFLCFSCGTQTVSNSEKEKIQKEVKEQINSTIKVLESADANGLMQTLLDSPDFRYAAGGRTSDYKSTIDFVTPFFGTLINQKGEIIKDNIVILDKSTVLYVAESKWTMNFKDGRTIVQEPWVWENLLKKVDGKWKTLYSSEFGSEKLVTNPEKQKELNQIELHKQFIGKWQASFGKDTICLMETKPFGTGLISDFKYLTAGKTFKEAKQLWGYNDKTDRYSVVYQEKGLGNATLSVYFVSKSKWLMIPSNFALYPDNSSVRWESDIVSPNQFNYFEVKDNKPGEIRKFMRIN